MHSQQSTNLSQLTYSSENMTFDNLLPLFSQPLEEAAKSIGTSSSHFKRLCRKAGIEKWPFRHLKRMKRELEESLFCLGSKTTKKQREVLIRKMSQYNTEWTVAVSQCISFRLSHDQHQHLIGMLRRTLENWIDCLLSEKTSHKTDNTSFHDSPIIESPSESSLLSESSSSSSSSSLSPSFSSPLSSSNWTQERTRKEQKQQKQNQNLKLKPNVPHQDDASPMSSASSNSSSPSSIFPSSSNPEHRQLEVKTRIDDPHQEHPMYHFPNRSPTSTLLNASEQVFPLNTASDHSPSSTSKSSPSSFGFNSSSSSFSSSSRERSSFTPPVKESQKHSRPKYSPKKNSRMNLLNRSKITPNRPSPFSLDAIRFAQSKLSISALLNAAEDGEEETP